MKRIEIKEKCPSCGGTGLYKGLAERDGFAVVCNKCKGTGCHVFVKEYDDFEERIKPEGIVRVIETNPGIVVGINKNLTYKSFGGLDFEDWWNGKEFTLGTEMRDDTCPAWWYQSANYDLKPDWEICPIWGAFSKCEHFTSKHICWKRFDNENK